MMRLRLPAVLLGAGVSCFPPSAENAPLAATDEWSLWQGRTQLRGANTWQKRPATPEDTLTPRYNPVDFRRLASWGANYVNLSIPGPFTQEKTGSPAEYRRDPLLWANLDSMVRKAENAGLRVVVAFRTGPGRNESVFGGEEDPVLRDLWHSDEAKNAWVMMWRETAALLKDRPGVVGYDLMVEPLLRKENPDSSVTPDDWYAFAERIVNAIRDVDGTTPILVSVAPGGSPDSLNNLNPARFDPANKRIVFTVHQYNPFDYTHQRTVHSGFDCRTGRPNGSQVDPPSMYGPDVKEEVERVYGIIRHWKNKHGVAVAVNELGVTRWVDRAHVFLREQLSLVEGLPANWALWVWDPVQCLGWDGMNFRNGPVAARHRETPNSALARTVREWWSKPADP